MFIQAAKIGSLGILAAIPLYVILYIYLKKSKGKLHDVVTKKGEVFNHTVKSYLLMAAPLVLCVSIFFIVGFIKVSASNADSADKSVATRDSVSSTVSPTIGETVSETTSTYDISFPHGRLVFQSTEPAEVMNDDVSIIRVEDGFMLVSGFGYDGDTDGVYEATRNHVLSNLPEGYSVTSDVLSKESGSYSFPTSNGSEKLSVPGWQIKGLVSVENKDAPMGVAGACVFDKDNHMIYSVVGFVDNGSNDVNMTAMGYLVNQAMVTSKIKVD